MRTEINLINKAKFFAQYFRQEVLKKSQKSEVIRLIGSDLNSRKIKEVHFLLLKPLSSITDEDAIEVAYLNGHVKSLTDNGKEDVLDFLNGDYWCLCFRGVDYLRSKGYALQWMGLSVEEMVEAGWVKLV